MFNSFIKDLKYIHEGKGWKTPNIFSHWYWWHLTIAKWFYPQILAGETLSGHQMFHSKKHFGRNTWRPLGDSLQESWLGKHLVALKWFLVMIIGWDSCQKYWLGKGLMVARCFSYQYLWDESPRGHHAILLRILAGKCLATAKHFSCQYF